LDSGKSLSYELKKIFRNVGYYGNSNRSILSYNQLEFIKGVKSGSQNEVVICECNTLIDAIERYGEIEIYEE